MNGQMLKLRQKDKPDVFFERLEDDPCVRTLVIIGIEKTTWLYDVFLTPFLTIKVPVNKINDVLTIEDTPTFHLVKSAKENILKEIQNAPLEARHKINFDCILNSNEKGFFVPYLVKDPLYKEPYLSIEWKNFFYLKLPYVYNAISGRLISHRDGTTELKDATDSFDLLEEDFKTELMDYKNKNTTKIRLRFKRDPRTLSWM